jgi:hypothetical protein
MGDLRLGSGLGYDRCQVRETHNCTNGGEAHASPLGGIKQARPSIQLGSHTSNGYKQLQSMCPAGILVLVLCRRELYHLVGEVATASVACGLMGVAGNKGAAAVSLTLFRR